MFFGPIEKIAAGQTTVVVATTTFKRRLKSAIRSVQLNKLKATKIQWPVVALFIVEEKVRTADKNSQVFLIVVRQLALSKAALGTRAGIRTWTMPTR